MDPDTAHELAVMEDALAGRATDPADAELAELVLLVAAERPLPRPEWAEELDARVAARFPARTAGAGAPAGAGAGEARRVSRLDRLIRHPWLAGAGTLAVAGVAAIVVLAGGGGDPSPVLGTQGNSDKAAQAQEPIPQSSERGPSGPTVTGVSGGLTRDSVKPDSGTAGSSAQAATPAPAPSGGGSAGAGRRMSKATPVTPSAVATTKTRRVEHSTQLTLGIKRRDMQSAAQQVFGIVTAAGGVVSSSNISAGQGANASFDLRIPTSRLQTTLARLAKLGHVRSENDTTLDLTAHYNSVSTNLADARAERAGLLRQLAKATTPNQTDSIKRRLRLAESRINTLSDQLAHLRTRTSFSRVALVMVPASSKSEPAPAKDGSSFGPDKALHYAGRILSVAGSVILLVLAIGGPLALLGLLAWTASRPVLRRRREQALDAAL